jgi:MerR family transcriptional regulator, light-induced transcriptional regulator
MLHSMTSKPPAAQPLTISDLAQRTGVSAATLRAWELRHGFPAPTRRASGHRRYDERDVALVKEVARRREAGVRLEAAIAAAAARRSDVAAATTSVFAELRRSHRHLTPHRLRKATLLSLSWAMEDECCARAQHPRLYGAFQEARFFDQARPRWKELARTARTAAVFADFGASSVDGGLALLHLPDDAPMRREWSLVCDAEDHTAVMAAWELPGQDGVSDRDRVFECIWSLEPRAVRDAARVCAQLAGVLDGSSEEPAEPDAPAPEGSDELRDATMMFERLLHYVDRHSR